LLDSTYEDTKILRNVDNYSTDLHSITSPKHLILHKQRCENLKIRNTLFPARMRLGSSDGTKEAGTEKRRGVTAMKITNKMHYTD